MRLLSNLPPHQASVFPRILHPLSPNQFKRQRLKQAQRIAAAKSCVPKYSFSPEDKLYSYTLRGAS